MLACSHTYILLAAGPPVAPDLAAAAASFGEDAGRAATSASRSAKAQGASQKPKAPSTCRGLSLMTSHSALCKDPTNI